MCFEMAEFEGVYVFMADDEMTAICLDSEHLDAEPFLPVYRDIDDFEFEEISPLR